jgi:hypothetical protein
VFDLQRGCFRTARLTIDRQTKGHLAEDSSYHLQSSYSEELIGNN